MMFCGGGATICSGLSSTGTIGTYAKMALSATIIAEAIAPCSTAVIPHMVGMIPIIVNIQKIRIARIAMQIILIRTLRDTRLRLGC